MLRLRLDLQTGRAAAAAGELDAFRDREDPAALDRFMVLQDARGKQFNLERNKSISNKDDEIVVI